MAHRPLVKPLVGVVDTRFCFMPLTRHELEACKRCVSSSVGSCIQVMPNHTLTDTGEISGFCFRSGGSEKASVIPMSKNCFVLFGMTAIYECASCKHSDAYNSIMNNLAETQARLQNLIAELESGEKNLNFECMHDWTSSMNVRDQREWIDRMPVKMGIYQCFMHTNAQKRARTQSVHCRFGQLLTRQRGAVQSVAGRA